MRGRKTSMCSCLSCTPTRDPACNPGMCPSWLKIKPMTLWFTGPLSLYWAHQPGQFSENLHFFMWDMSLSAIMSFCLKNFLCHSCSKVFVCRYVIISFLEKKCIVFRTVLKSYFFFFSFSILNASQTILHVCLVSGEKSVLIFIFVSFMRNHFFVFIWLIQH